MGLDAAASQEEPQPGNTGAEPPPENAADNSTENATTETAPDGNAVAGGNAVVEENALVEENAGADIHHADSSQWPQRDFPLTGAACEQPVRIVVRQSVLNEIRQHGQSRTDVEICGVFAGNGFQDANGPYVYIQTAIRGQHSDSQAAQVTFTGETWSHIQNQLDEQHPEQRIIGWYHTHPGFGVFLSGMDMFIQTSVFYAPEQMAFVYDPISGEEGLFVWRNGDPQRSTYMIEPDTPADPAPGALHPDEPAATTAPANLKTDETGDTEMSQGGGSTAELQALTSRIERLERRQRQGVVAFMLTAFIAVIAPLAVWLSIQPGLHKFFPSGGRSLFQQNTPEQPPEPSKD